MTELYHSWAHPCLIVFIVHLCSLLLYKQQLGNGMTLNICQLINETENMLQLHNGILVSCKMKFTEKWMKLENTLSEVTQALEDK